MKKYITAKELAEELLKNPEDIVCVSSDNFEQNYAKEGLTSKNLYRFKGNFSLKRFRDAFDNETYSSEVVDSDPNGKINFVKI